jgi:hypothetical protein
MGRTGPVHVSPDLMNRDTVRRQVWLLILLAGLALLWWRSSVSDRYGDLSSYGARQQLLPVPPGVGTTQLTRALESSASWRYSSPLDSTAIVVRWQTIEGVTTAEIITTNSDRVVRRVEAELLRGYYPEHLAVHDLRNGTTHDIRISGDSMHVRRTGEAGGPRAFPYPHGAIFEDLILLQGMAWKNLADSATTQVIACSSGEAPVRVFKVELSKRDSSTLLITASPTQSADLRFAKGSPRIESYGTTTGTRYESQSDTSLEVPIRDLPGSSTNGGATP